MAYSGGAMPVAGRRRPLSNLGRRHRPDYGLLLLSVILLVIGLIVIYSISPGLGAQKNVSDNYYAGKQLIAMLLGVGAFVITSNTPLSWWHKAQKPLLWAAVAAAVAVRLFGERVNGAYRWIQIGGLSFQAAELIKFALLVWLAGFLTERIREGSLGDPQKAFKPLLITLGAIAVVVAGIQSDLGSSGVMVIMIAAMVFVAGLPLKRLFLIGGVVAIGTVLLISTSSYRRARLETFLNPTRDCQTTGYQACQALIAVGSGGMVGLGLGRSVQAYGYLPEAANDSIFAILAEKFGFIGTALLLGAFALFFSRLVKIMERTPDTYNRLLVVGILAWLSTQTLINIGAMIGLLPLKGITLPFISSGGTSLIFICGAIGIAFQISRYTTFGAISEQTTGSHDGRAYDNSTGRRRVRGAYHPGLGSR
jgi:cell division protein FtsW